MAWIDEAELHTSRPVALVEIVFTDAGKREYSIDYIRPIGDPAYKGNILRLPTIYNSVGDLMRAFEFSKIAIEFSDTDYEFRTLIETEGIKNRQVTIKIAFPNRSLATESLTVFVGNIYDWDPLAGLRFVINCEQKSKNMGNEYPDKVVERGDYPNAHADALGKVIPIIWGTISQAGGAFPTLFVDTSNTTERYLVGLQSSIPLGAGANITVSAVYVDGDVQTPGVGNDYDIVREDIDGRRHTRIHFYNTAVPQPTEDTVVTCDLVFGAREVCEAIKYFMINFCGYIDGDFNDVSYQAAHLLEQNRGFTFNGAFTRKQTLSTILNAIKDEFELDMWWEPKDGLIHFNYLSSSLNPPITHYKDTFDILKGYKPGMQVEKILNYLRYGYNYNYAHDYFYNYDHHEDTDSQTKHGGIYTEFFGFRFVRSSIIAHDLASRKVLRRKEPVVFDTFPLPLKSFEDNLAEVVKITHFEGTGAAGYVQKLFQIRKTSYDIDRFVNSMIAEDVDAFFGIACILGDATALPVLWADAVGFQRNYCYLCAGETVGVEVEGEFRDGEPGKQLRD